MKLVVFGAGQLAQMMYLAAAPLGVQVQAVDVNSKQVVHPVSKQPLNIALDEAFKEAQAITVEFENVPNELLIEAQQTGKLAPNNLAISAGADRIREKQLLDKLGIANVEYVIIDDVSKLNKALDTIGEEIVFKTAREGYDGYGQWRINSAEQLDDLRTVFTGIDLSRMPVVAEKMVAFDRELSVIGARNIHGETRIYNLVENEHHQGQLHMSIAPAPRCSQALQVAAENIFHKIATELNYVGVLAVEMFEINQQLLVNEIAPRVHNSGHWTQDGAETSQFEQHVRAVLDFPLGDSQAYKPTLMVNIIGCTSFSRELISIPGANLHWYGKAVREKRKMGHINIIGDSYLALSDKLTELKAYLPTDYFPKVDSQINLLKKADIS